MKSKTKIFFLWVAALMLAGCQSTTAPFSAGVDDSGTEVFVTGYMVRGGFTDWNDVKRKSYEQASAFCAKKGLRMHEVQMATKGARGWTPQESSMRFTCIK